MRVSNRIKDKEIKLADFILTLSELARESYLKAGVPGGKVFVLPLGVDLSLFKPPENRLFFRERRPISFFCLLVHQLLNIKEPISCLRPLLD